MKNIKFRKLNLINFQGVKEKIRIRSKMFAIDKKLVNRLSIPLRQIVYLSFGRIRGLSTKAKVCTNFLTFVLKMKKNHGTLYTIKWLKACYVALQKFLGDDRVLSLRDLEANLPLPRTINGLPAYIKADDRRRIREGDKATIIFWSSLFSIYRVLKSPYKLKTETITDPFNGDRV